jgi:colicin import membrane protein
MNTKQILIAMMLCLPTVTMAQSTDTTDTPKKTLFTSRTADKKVTDPKYLAGAVPEVNGMVLFRQDYDVAGKSKQEIYQLLLPYLSDFAAHNNELGQSSVYGNDANEGTIAVRLDEWVTFKKKALVWDRTRMSYQLIAYCEDGKFHVEISHINYLYGEDENQELWKSYKAEEWINDANGLTKKQDKTSKYSGKFRIKTIDRKDEIFESISYYVKAHS